MHGMQGTYVTKENEGDIEWSGHMGKRGHMVQRRTHGTKGDT